MFVKCLLKKDKLFRPSNRIDLNSLFTFVFNDKGVKLILEMKDVMLRFFSLSSLFKKTIQKNSVPSIQEKQEKNSLLAEQFLAMKLKILRSKYCWTNVLFLVLHV